MRERDRRRVVAQTRDRGLIATSQFSAQTVGGPSSTSTSPPSTWSTRSPSPGSATQPRRPGPVGVTRVLYAGRLSPEKGIYTLLAMLHIDLVEHDMELTFTATTAGADKPQGEIISTLLQSHPGIRLVPARKTPAAMAELMVDYDVVVMPSNSQYWHETFGIVSIEAQHAGCRVVASDDGGLPETDCGAITLVVPDDAEALARGIRAASALGPLSPPDRRHAATRFTVAESVDELLAVLDRPRPITPAAIVRELEALALLPPRTPSVPSALQPHFDATA